MSEHNHNHPQTHEAPAAPAVPVTPPAPATEPVIPPTPTVFDSPLSFIRNGFTVTMKIFTGKSKTWKGRKYQAPQIEVTDLETPASKDPVFLNGVDVIGKVNVQNFLNNILRRLGQDFIIDATDETTGLFDLPKYIGFWEKLKSSAMKLSELTEAYDAAVAEYQAFCGTELIGEITSGDPVRIANAKAKNDKLNHTLNSLRAEWEERKAKKSKEAEAETVTAE